MSKSILQLTQQLDAIDGNDISGGMAVYGELHNLSEGIGQSVSSWMYRTAFALWDENEVCELAFQKDGEELAAHFKKLLQEGIDSLITICGPEYFQDDSGRNTLKLSGENPLSSAFRKMENGLKKEIDLTQFISVRAVQDEVTRLNKEAKKQESAESKKNAALAKIESELLAADPDLAVDPEELAKAVEAKYADIEAAKAERTEQLRAVEAIKVKHPVPDFLFTSEAVAEVFIEYITVLADRPEAHMSATGISKEVAMEQLIKAIEGDIERQRAKIDEWNEAIIGAADKLRNKIAS